MRTSQKQRRATRLLAALSPDQLQDMLSPVIDHLFLAYERVVMPCHNMNCGDVVHRRFVLDVFFRSDAYTKVLVVLFVA